MSLYIHLLHVCGADAAQDLLRLFPLLTAIAIGESTTLTCTVATPSTIRWESHDKHTHLQLSATPEKG